MKNKPFHQYLFLAMIFLVQPFILPAQITEHQRQVFCQNNKEAIPKVEKKIKELEEAQKNLWDSKKIKAVRPDYDEVITFLYKLERFRATKPVEEKGTDKDYMIELINPAYDMEPTYTGRETLMENNQKDFTDKGALIGTQPANTIKALRVIRDSIARKIDRSVKLRPGIDQELKEARDKLTYHHNRMIELKCDELPDDKAVPVETEKKEEKEDKPDKKNPEPYQEASIPAEIELTETTDKYGTFTATLKWNAKANMYDGVYTNGGKDRFQLRQFEGTTFFLVRLNSYASYGGTISGNKIQGTFITGGATGTFTASVK